MPESIKKIVLQSRSVSPRSSTSTGFSAGRPTGAGLQTIAVLDLPAGRRCGTIPRHPVRPDARPLAPAQELAMEDHDQRFKVLLKSFFAEFFQVFFPAWADRFDFPRVDWLEQEVFPDPPRGERRSLDLVARLPLRPGVPPPAPALAGPIECWLTLIHVEIESRDKVAPLRPRMHSYYEQLRRRHGLPVLPIALYLRVGLDGIGWDAYEEHFWEQRILRFEYAYVGLPGLDGEWYVAGEHPLGVALTALMRVPPARRAAVHAEALRRLAEARENEYRRYLLLDCLEAVCCVTDHRIPS
jgi:hypothetical protein